jgi:hypothetical protein
MSSKVRTVSTKAGWTKTDRNTYTHETGIRVIRNVNERMWYVAGASKYDGHAWRSLWMAMHFAAQTPAEWQ